MAHRSKTLRRICKGALFFTALASVIFLVHYLDIPAFDETVIDTRIRNGGIQGILLYITMTALGSAVGIPRQMLSFLGGYAFGAAAGTLFATIGTAMGCAGGFFFARFFARNSIIKKFASPMRRLDAFLSRSPFSMTLVVRLLPIGNNALTSLLAGVTSIPARWFLAGSFLGYLPQNYIFSLLGSGIRVDPFWRVTASAVLFSIATATGYALYKRHKVSQTLEGMDIPGSTSAEKDSAE